MTMNSGEPETKTMPSGYGIIWNWDLNDTCWVSCCIDGCNMYESYHRGLGGPYGGCGNCCCAGGEDYKLLYYKKGNETWGTPLDLTSKDEVRVDLNISVYPNPASDYIIAESESEEIDIIYLYDLSGKVLMKEQCHSRQHLLSLSTIEPGIYILSIKSESGLSQHKIIVE